MASPKDMSSGSVDMNLSNESVDMDISSESVEETLEQEERAALTMEKRLEEYRLAEQEARERVDKTLSQVAYIRGTIAMLRERMESKRAEK